MQQPKGWYPSMIIQYSLIPAQLDKINVNKDEFDFCTKVVYQLLSISPFLALSRLVTLDVDDIYFIPWIQYSIIINLPSPLLPRCHKLSHRSCFL